jgi:DNA-directed RNA polymerase subunit K/omega
MHQQSNPSLITRDNEKIAEPTENLYASLIVIAKRARQIASNHKEELNNKLAEFASSVDNLEEIFENREQIEISKFYERMAKPTSLATDEFLEGKLNYRLIEKEEETSGSDLV